MSIKKTRISKMITFRIENIYNLYQNENNTSCYLYKEILILAKPIPFGTKYIAIAHKDSLIVVSPNDGGACISFEVVNLNTH